MQQSNPSLNLTYQKVKTRDLLANADSKSKTKMSLRVTLIRIQHCKTKTMIFDVSTLDVNPLILDMNIDNLMYPWKLTLYLSTKSSEI